MNSYYDHGTFPQNNTQASSASMRQELDAIETGFNKLPEPHPTEKGWTDPVHVGAASAVTHAVQQQQVAALAIAAVPDNSIAMSIALG